jgi:hypothetical protein
VNSLHALEEGSRALKRFNLAMDVLHHLFKPFLARTSMMLTWPSETGPCVGCLPFVVQCRHVMVLQAWPGASRIQNDLFAVKSHGP